VPKFASETLGFLRRRDLDFHTLHRGTPRIEVSEPGVSLAKSAAQDILTCADGGAVAGQLYERGPPAYRVAMVVGASLNVAERAGRGIRRRSHANERQGHEMTACTFAARTYSCFVDCSAVKAPSPACDEPRRACRGGGDSP
jgi:nucleoside phosphorylase